MTWEIHVDLDREARKTMVVASQLKARLRALQKYVAYASAERTLDGITGILAKGQHRKYLRSLRLSRVEAGKKVDAYTVHARPQSHGVREVDPARTVVYIRAKRKRLARSPRALAILERYNPWTLDTLPFMPSRREAVVVTREVSQREVQAVADERNAQRPTWRAELTRAGYEIDRRDRIVLPRTAGTTVPDVAFDALRIEFGLGGQNALPHWRPSIRGAVRWVSKGLSRDPRIRHLLTDSGYTAWKRWVPRVRSVRPSEAVKFISFQKRLGIKPSGGMTT